MPLKLSGKVKALVDRVYQSERDNPKEKQRVDGLEHDDVMPPFVAKPIQEPHS
jgi:hypothetical protein